MTQPSPFRPFETDLDEVRALSVLRDAVAGAEDGELYLERRRSEVLSFDDGRLRNAAYDSDQGFGLRTVLGGAAGYAHSSEFSEAALKTYCAWFLKVALDQITFSAKLFDLGGLDKRYRRLVADTIDDKRAPDLVSAVLRHGALERGEAQFVLKTSERTARNTLKQLTSAGFLASASPKTPVRLAFPLDYRERLFPNLFADADLPE